MAADVRCWSAWLAPAKPPSVETDWWEILQFDGLVYMLRGVFAVRRLIILRNLFAVVRLACRGESVLGQPARVPMGLDARAVRAVIAFEDITPVVMHRHSLHVIIHLV